MKTCQYFILLLAILLLACQATNKQKSVEPTPLKGVAIYLIATPIDLVADPTALDKISPNLEREPIINYNQITAYSPNSYTFTFTSEVVERLKEVSKELPLVSRPFALVADGSVVYYGLFFNPLSSYGSGYPFITLFDDSLSKKPVSEQIVMQVDFRKPYPGGPTRPDLRNDPRLLDRLRKDNKLK